MGNTIIRALKFLAFLLERDYSRLVDKENKVLDKIGEVQAQAEDSLDLAYEKAEEELARIRRQRDELQRRVEDESRRAQQQLGARLEKLKQAEVIDFRVLNAIKPIIKSTEEK